MSTLTQWANIDKLRNKRMNSSELNLTLDQQEIFSPNKTLTRRLLFPAEASKLPPSSRGVCLAYPEGQLKTAWDLIAIVCMSVQAVIVPLTLAFSNAPDYWYYLDFSTQLFFCLDIALNFNLAYYELGALVTSRRKIATHYMKRWFIIDLVSTASIDYVLYCEEPCSSQLHLKSIQLLRLAKAMRLIRLAKLNKIFFRLEDSWSNKSITSCLLFGRLVLILCIFAHWIACLWIFIGNLSIAGPNSWIASMDVQDETASVVYVTALYWSLTTMVSLGYGDVKPTNTTEIYFGSFAVVVASVVLQYLLGNITAFIAEMSASEALYREQSIALNCFMKEKAFPENLRGKVKRYLDFIWEHSKNTPLESSIILPFLSKPLRNEIFTKTRGVVFKTLSVFQSHFSRQVLQLSENLTQMIYAPEDIIISEGELTSTIYFIQAGVVDVYHKSSRSSYKQLSDGQFFGEVAFFSKLPRTASVRTECFTEIYALERAVMDEVCKESPESATQLMLLQQNILEGNLICIGIMCYVCEKPGHVAIHCTSVLIINDKQKLALEWVKNRSKRSKKINAGRSNTGSHTRKQKLAKTPVSRTAHKSPYMQRVVKDYLSSFTGSSKRKKAQPRYSQILYHDSEQSNITEGAEQLSLSNMRDSNVRETIKIQYDSEEEVSLKGSEM